MTMLSRPSSRLPPPSTPDDPKGNFESMTQVAAGARLVGWALDRDTTNAVEIDVYEGPCQVYACTLKGLTTALEDARIWSFRGTRGLLALVRPGCRDRKFLVSDHRADSRR
jgi:hypothetical protein